MSISRKIILSSASAALLAFTALSAKAEEARPREPVIIVSGEAQAAVAPDQAIMTFAVVREAKTAREALDANNDAMAKVLAELKKLKIADRDLQTSGFSVEPQYFYPEDNDGRNKPPELTGYRISNTLTIRLRDINQTGAVLDRVVTLGVNQGGDIRFVNEDPSKAIAKARAEAMKDAKAKASVLAEAAGVKLGRVLEISETSGRPEPVPMVRMTMAKEAADAAVPIASGENSYSVSVNATFAIEQ
ncbi:SIMPL domain-containing protein [Rhizobium alvei]|uniref:SIMPL domain-containing protein n=1 Tax=Rhizobium alvei TaxID=1132659 RepID=A0ABT8YV55_9HYPH|nr:SIMPL domain-containing protein [Rhizobium alvei]MDO6967088.1 SIMPL domain-containing protein [Rhizobium alvei]